MCCCKKKIEKLETEVTNLRTEVELMKAAFALQASPIETRTASSADAITRAVADSTRRNSTASISLRQVLTR